MSRNYRCTTCKTRLTLKKRRKIVPKCPGCGKDTLKDITDSERARTKKRNCHCDGWWWSMKGGPHHKGSAPWCIHSTREPTEEEWRERYVG